MRLKPVRFIGHKIGPFDHIELNWDQDSRHTLIVAENGMGKTTLITAMAACLSFGDNSLSPHKHFQRFAHDEESFACLEVAYEDQPGWILRWTVEAQKLRSEMPEMQFPLGMPKLGRSSSISGNPASWSPHLAPIPASWAKAQNIRELVAAYGVSRDIQRPEIQEFKDLETNPMMGILDPFAEIKSSEIFQWIVNQQVNHALALSENELEEAEAYIVAVQRVEQMVSDALNQSVKFILKRNPFRLEIEQNNTILSVEQLSDGTRSFLGWLLDYLMRASRLNWANPADASTAPGMILVDEIDSHLHPEWQRRVMSIISQLLPETYVIATTHSPFVVGSVDDAQVFQIYRGENGKLDVKASYDELYGYPADLVLKKAFVPSLYPPEMEQKLERLSELAGKRAAKTITPDEEQEHDKLLVELAKVNPWLENVLALSQVGG